MEPLARREPSQRWREIIHVVQHGERKRVRQFAFRPARRAPHPGRHHRGTPGAIKSVWQAALSGLASLGVEGLAVQARTAVALLDALGIARAHWVGNSQGGQSAMVAAIAHPERVSKFVMGGSHIGTGGDRYLAHRRRELSDRRAGGLHPPRAHLVTRVYRSASAIGQPAARLHARPPRHPGPGPLDPWALRPDGALRGLDRDPQPHCRLAPGIAQQLRPPAALREARRVDRTGPRVPQGLLRFDR
ncbi:MAG: alpha/beta fold hydrolase [Alphaproteobacteria bacterium]|nr:MAG: alpha/beta fold hydrolase [Alphaproteobacteria bacterium]